MTRPAQSPRSSLRRTGLALAPAILACALSGTGCSSLLLTSSAFGFAPGPTPSVFGGARADGRVIAELAEEGVAANFPWLVILALDLPLSLTLDTVTAPLVLLFFHRRAVGDWGREPPPHPEASEPEEQPPPKETRLPYGYEALFPKTN